MKNSNLVNMQDSFLNVLRKEKVMTTVFMTNGFQLKGVIKSFDNFVIVVECDGRQNMIYKHAVSTITPSRYIMINIESEE